MKYSELIEKYEKGELNETEAGEVERDIERHEAISDYLAEREDIPELEMLHSNGNKGEAAQNDGAADFTKKIKRQIRKAFLKAGLITGLLVLGIVFFCMYALPKIIERAYYDPTEKVGFSADQQGSEEMTGTNRLSMDISVYSELLLPGSFRQSASAESLGYGKYTVNIHQNFAHNGIFRDTAGVIDRGRLTLYDPNLLTMPVMNIFDTVKAGISGVGASFGGYDWYEDIISDMQPGDRKLTYVTFASPMDYDDAIAWCEENGVNAEWGAICTGNEIKPGVYYGARFALSGVMEGYDREKYPYLTVYSVANETDFSVTDYASKELMAKHITSLLRYFADNVKGMQLFSKDDLTSVAQGFRESADYIEANGFSVYGLAFMADAEKITELHGLESVAYMFAENVK